MPDRYINRCVGEGGAVVDRSHRVCALSVDFMDPMDGWRIIIVICIQIDWMVVGLGDGLTRWIGDNNSRSW